MCLFGCGIVCTQCIVFYECYLDCDPCPQDLSFAAVAGFLELSKAVSNVMMKFTNTKSILRCQMLRGELKHHFYLVFEQFDCVKMQISSSGQGCVLQLIRNKASVQAAREKTMIWKAFSSPNQNFEQAWSRLLEWEGSCASWPCCRCRDLASFSMNCRSVLFLDFFCSGYSDIVMNAWWWKPGTVSILWSAKHPRFIQTVYDEYPGQDVRP